MPSESIENYLKTIYELEEQNTAVTTSAIAEKLNVSPASVTGMLKRLSQKEPLLIQYESHQQTSLTPLGLKTALRIIRQHRLLELFLHKVLGIPWDKLHSDAEKLEHYISDYLEDKIDHYLGHPQFDPHGAPIPEKDGTLPDTKYVRLSSLSTGQHAIVKRVMKDDPDLLNYLTAIGLFINVTVHIIEIISFDNTLIIKTGTDPNISPIHLTQQVADQIFVQDSN